jgi:hypothetical protein
MWDDVDTWVEVVGGRDAEIRWGWGVLTKKSGYRADTVDIACPLKMRGGACRGSTWYDIDMQVEVVGGCNQRIERGWGFDPQKTNIECVCPISPAHRKNCMQQVGGVQGLGWMLNLRARLVVNARTSGARHLASKTETRAAQAWFGSGVCK